MAYAQDTITSPNAANVFVGVLDGLLLSAGWTVVENFNPSGTFQSRVYKSAGADNLCGYDWYLVICWQATGTTRYTQVWAGESYNPTTKVFSGRPVSGGAFGADCRANGQFESTNRPLNLNTYQVSTTDEGIEFTQSGNGAATQFGFQTILPAAAFGYWMSVTRDHVALFTTVSGKRDAIYSTLIMEPGYEADPLYKHTPIVGFDSTYGVQLSSAIIVGANPNNSVYTRLAQAATGPFGSQLPLLSDTYYDAYAVQSQVALVSISQGLGNATPNTTIAAGVVIGRIPDWWIVWGGSIGDTVDIDGATYVLSSVMSGASTVAVRVE